MKNRRILFVDVLRGMTIFFMIMVNTPGSWKYLYPLMQHAGWHGCKPADLIFPSFLFVIGISMSISFRKFIPTQRNTLLINVLRRSLIIFLIGLLLNWFPFYYKNIEDLRIFGVLPRIALAFLGAGIITAFITNTRILIIIVITLLFGHWALLYGFGGADPYALESNISGPFDVLLFGESHIYKGFGIPFDPEGLVGTLPSIAQILLGYMIGSYMLRFGTSNLRNLKLLTGISIAMIAAGLSWSVVFPVNKPLWTGSYVLYTTGIVSMVWVLLIRVIDLQQFHSWSFVFRVFGRNPLISFILSICFVKTFIYLIRIEGTTFYGWSYKYIFQSVFGNYFGSFMFALSFTFFIWLFAYWLYKKGKIIKV